MVRYPISAVVVAFALVACTGEDTGPEYFSPIADAGADFTVKLGDDVCVDGAASESHPSFGRAFTWAFEQVPVEAQIDDSAFGATNGTSAAERVCFAATVEGAYVISLVVSDGVEISPGDFVVVTVAADNQPPEARAGDDVRGRVGARTVLDGSASSDPEGARLEYYWSLAAKPESSALGGDAIYDQNTATPSFVPDVAGPFVLSLVVSDGLDFSEPDSVTVVVGTDNLRPIADAGGSATLAPCNADVLQLNGFGSYDPDGDPLTYQWSVYSVPSGSAVSDADFDDSTRPNPRVAWDALGTYVFHLQVNDGLLISAIDEVSLTVVDPTTNQSPVANAGADQTIDATAECTSSDYVWTCGDCPPVAFALDASFSYDPDGDDLSYRWTDPSGEMKLSSEFTAYTQARSTPTDATYSVASTTSWTVDLEVADCALSASDSVKLTVSCTGEK